MKVSARINDRKALLLKNWVYYIKLISNMKHHLLVSLIECCSMRHFFYSYSHIVNPNFFPIKFTFFLCYPLHCINKPKFKTNRNDVNPAKPNQNIPKVTRLIKRITIQNTIARSWGAQKNMEFTIEITLVCLEEAKYQV